LCICAFVFSAIFVFAFAQMGLAYGWYPSVSVVKKDTS
jgi:hypothetical protein